MFSWKSIRWEWWSDSDQCSTAARSWSSGKEVVKSHLQFHPCMPHIIISSAHCSSCIKSYDIHRQIHCRQETLNEVNHPSQQPTKEEDSTALQSLEAKAVCAAFIAGHKHCFIDRAMKLLQKYKLHQSRIALAKKRQALLQSQNASRQGSALSGGDHRLVQAEASV